MATIGITDSGMGGLTILNALFSNNKCNNYIYYADIANCPYGMKSSKEITELTRNCCNKLIEMGADIIVIACNTATSAAIDTLRQEFKIPIVGTEPAVMPAIADKSKKILVLATPYTINSERYYKLINKYEDRIINCPCSDLARLIEDFAPDFIQMYDYMESILKPFRDCNAIVLGCTHYVLLKDIIHRIMPNVALYDSSSGIVRQVNYLIDKNKIPNSLICEGNIKLLSTNNCNMDNYNKVLTKINKRE